MLRTLLFVSGSASIGYALYTFFYWRQMHCTVRLEHGALDAPHILLILMIVGFILSFF